MRPRRLGTAAAMAVCLVIPAAGFAAAIPPDPPSANVTAFDRPSSVLPPDPVLHVGEPVLVVVIGFADGATVAVRVVGTRFFRRRHADRHGVLRLPYAVTADGSEGQFLMTFEGPASVDAGSRHHGASQGQSIISGDRQAVRVTVPVIGLFPFRVSRAGIGGIGSRPPSAGPSAGTLSHTGADVRGLLMFALAVCVAGTGALLLGRRTRHRR